MLIILGLVVYQTVVVCNCIVYGCQYQLAAISSTEKLKFYFSMDFGKDDIAPTRNIQMLPESGSASILSQESISINENNVGTNVMTLGLPVSNFYQEGIYVYRKSYL